MTLDMEGMAFLALFIIAACMPFFILLLKRHLDKDLLREVYPESLTPIVVDDTCCEKEKPIEREAH
ncbi:hypothetical protein [Neptuniibacter sp. QD37_11]|uniref:hypothetical protein n=1 Tax=Neptuniibacter sp. QD37_11 TaxID=3398209 RepID=UPI0039F4EE37